MSIHTHDLDGHSPAPTDAEAPRKKSRRGFASMPKAVVRSLGKVGGRKAQAAGTAHRFSAESAAAAGRRGGGKTSEDREHMAQAGKKGGTATANLRRAAAESACILQATGNQPLAATAEAASPPAAAVDGSAEAHARD